MSNEIKTTMTMDQQQMLRELQRQHVALLKNAQAFLDVAKAGQRSGQGIKQSFDLSMPSIRQLSTTIVGFGTLTDGVIAGVRKSVQLMTADFEKFNKRAVAALESTRSPANAIRQAALNVRPEELAWLQSEVGKLSADPTINATIETGARVLSGIRSAAGNAPLKDIARTAQVTLRGVGPDRPDAAEQFGIALMDAMSTERRFTPDLTPEATFGGMLALQAGSHMAGIEDTAKSFGPLQAAMGMWGQRFHETAAPFGALTVFNKDQTGQVSAEGFRKTSEELMSYTPENDAKRLERLGTMFDESLNSTDFAGTKDTEKRTKYRDRLAALDLKDPSRQAEEMIKLLEEIQSAYREGSDTRLRLGRDIARLKIAQTHQRSTDIHGMPIDVPVSEVETFKAAKTPVEKLWTMATKTPTLAKSAEANIEFGRGKTREFFVGWMKNDPLITKSIRDAEKEMPALTNDRAGDFDKWLSNLNKTRLQVMARSQQHLQAAAQKLEVSSTLDQRYAHAKKIIETMHEKVPTGPVHQWLETKIKPFFESEEASVDPEKFVLPRLEEERDTLIRHLNEGKPERESRRGFKGTTFTPYSVEEREQREAQIRFTQELIKNLRRTKEEMASPPSSRQPVPAGQEVGAIDFVPDERFNLAGGGDEMFARAALAQRPRNAAGAMTEEEAAAAVERFHAENNQWQNELVQPAEPEALNRLLAAVAGVPAQVQVADSPVPRRSAQDRIRDEVIQKAMEVAEREGIKRVTRKGLEETAGMYGQDVNAFAIKVKDFFHGHAERRREESKDWQIDVDSSTGEGTPFKDASVDRLFRAGGEIQDLPIREMQRSNAERFAMDQAAEPAQEAVGPVAFDDPRPLAPFDAAGFMGQSVASAEELPDVEHVPTPETSFMRPARARYQPKPFAPSDPDRVAKAKAAMAAARDRKAANPKASKRPFMPSDPDRVAKANAAVERSHEPREPSINVQGGDTKPVVGEIKNTNQLMEQLLGQFKEVAALLKNQPLQTSRGGRERTSTRPAAGLAAR